MSLVEWGREFPISGRIQQLLDYICHSYKEVKRVIRTLNVISFLFADSTILVFPVRFLQNVQNIQSLQSYLQGKTTVVPKDVLFIENENPVIDLISVSDPVPVIVSFKQNGKYDVVSLDKDGNLQTKLDIPLSIQLGELVRVFVQNGIITIVCNSDSKSLVYSAKFKASDPIVTFSIQCELEAPTDIYVHPPCLYVIKEDSVCGCALDDKGFRKFPRPLTPFLEGHYLPISTFSDFLIFNKDTREVSRIVGNQQTIISQIATESSSIQHLVAIGNRLFALSSHHIDVFDIVTGEQLSDVSVPDTQNWIISVDPTYGAVFLGAAAFAISKAEIGPLVNIYAEEAELLEQMRRARQTAGTVAAPIMLLANRSPYLAATMMADDIANECEKAAVPGTIQESVRPMLLRLNDLLLHKPK